MAPSQVRWLHLMLDDVPKCLVDLNGPTGSSGIWKIKIWSNIPLIFLFILARSPLEPLDFVWQKKLHRAGCWPWKLVAQVEGDPRIAFLYYVNGWMLLNPCGGLKQGGWGLGAGGGGAGWKSGPPRALITHSQVRCLHLMFDDVPKCLVDLYAPTGSSGIWKMQIW